MTPNFRDESGDPLDDPDEEPEDPTENLPAGTRRVIYDGVSLTAKVTDDWYDPDFFDGLDADDPRPRQVEFERGEEVPLALAGKCYDAFSDLLSCQDGNGKVIDGAGPE